MVHRIQVFTGMADPSSNENVPLEHEVWFSHSGAPAQPILRDCARAPGTAASTLFRSLRGQKITHPLDRLRRLACSHKQQTITIRIFMNSLSSSHPIDVQGSATEQNFREKIAEIQETNRMLADFAALVSHDLQSGLRGVGSFAALLRVVPAIAGDAPNFRRSQPAAQERAALV